MKKEKLSQALNDIDLRYIEEADSFQKEKKVKVSKTWKWVAVAVCFAFLVLTGKPIVNYATTIYHSVTSYFKGETELYMEEILSRVTSVSNEELELRVEGVIADERYCYMIVSFIGLTEEMENRLLEGNLEEQDLFEKYVIWKDGAREEHWASGSITYTKEAPFGRKAESVIPDAHMTYVISYQFDDNNLSETEAIGFAFEGLAVEVDVNDYLAQMYHLEAENGEGKITDVFMSSISFGFTSHFDTPATDEDVAVDKAEYDIRLIRADGTVLTLKEMGESIGYSYSGGYSTGDTEEYIGGCWVEGHMPKILDLEDYCGMQINGVNYYYVTE